MTFASMKLKRALVASAAGVWGDEPTPERGVPILRSTDIDINGVIDPRNAALRDLAPRDLAVTRLRVGDLVVVKSSGSDAHLGKAGLVTAEVAAGGFGYSNFLQRLRVSASFESRFVWYFLNSSLVKNQVKLLSSTSTGLQNLSASLIGELALPVPSLDEQRRIANFLDVETARIGRLVGARKRQLKLIEERELSRVFNAVSGSEEPGPRKISGLRWIKDVPVDWPVLTVSSQYEVLLGKMLNQDRVRGKHLRPYLRNSNVQWDHIETEDLLCMDFPPHERSRYEVRAGDLLICEGGQPGRCAVWDGAVKEIYYQKALHRARSRGRSSVWWLFYCLRAATAVDVFSAEGNSTTIGHLTGEQLREHRFPFPERKMQDRLVLQLQEAAEWSKKTACSLAGQVDLFTERRQAVITAAVTGAIDVTTASGMDA
ncbi:restriction endonuclease subunit S [Micromonospora sp. NPDC048894]|uniref:restriction endonuclease subunit S n=1 Tax=Micromonospora sp. NPDC048894 TaxID=3155493 RepID=UPI0033FC4746